MPESRHIPVCQPLKWKYSFANTCRKPNKYKYGRQLDIQLYYEPSPSPDKHEMPYLAVQYRPRFLQSFQLISSGQSAALNISPKVLEPLSKSADNKIFATIFWALSSF